MATPRIRNPLLRTIYEHNTDERFQRASLRKFNDVSKWYSCDTDKLPPWLASKFVQSSLDQSTESFLDNCYEKSGWLLTQMWHSVAKGVLSFFMSVTSVNGLLRRGSMFVFSREQIQRLLGVEEGWKVPCIIDLGAGDGEVTMIMDSMCQEVYATEIAWTMQWRLSEKGYKVLPIDAWTTVNSGISYDVISCLNLLDRCDQPLTLLKDMKDSLSPTGVIIVAVVLPLAQYVETGSQNKPSEVVEVKGKTWEDQVQSLVEGVFHPAGLQVRSFSRVPYLCEGDATTPFYILDDALFILEPSDRPASSRNKPSEVIEVKSQTWEEHMQSLVEGVFHSAGLQVRSLSHVPYLCKGDTTIPFCSLFVPEGRDLDKSGSSNSAQATDLQQNTTI